MRHGPRRKANKSKPLRGSGRLPPTTDEIGKGTIMNETNHLEPIIAKYSLTLRSCDPVDSNPNMSDADARMDHYKMVVANVAGFSATFHFSQGRGRVNAPTLSDLIECLVLDTTTYSEPFETWAAEQDYNPDSRKAYATWEAVKENADKLRYILSGLDFDAFLNDAQEALYA